MNSSPTSEMQKANMPISSLVNKAEKALRKLAPGTWQHARLQDNLKAGHIALALMNRCPSGAPVTSRDDLLSALNAFAALTSSSVNAQVKFAPGTPQHTLLRNRLQAFRAAESLINAELK